MCKKKLVKLYFEAKFFCALVFHPVARQQTKDNKGLKFLAFPSLCVNELMNHREVNY